MITPCDFHFSGLSSEKKGIVVAGVCIVTVATAGWASWGFIIWGKLLKLDEIIVTKS